MWYPAGELLVFGLELLFQAWALCYSSTVLELFKGLKLYGLYIYVYTRRPMVSLWNLNFTLENECLDRKKNNMQHMG